jgi:ATP/maltotriose-dependent transcriptional regulator MalT
MTTPLLTTKLYTPPCPARPFDRPFVSAQGKARARHEGTVAPSFLDLLLRDAAEDADETRIAPGAAPTQVLVDRLSERELEVLRLIAQGKTNREIASEIFIAAWTVKAHTASIYRKVDVRNRTEAVTRARELKLVNGVHT